MLLILIVILLLGVTLFLFKLMIVLTINCITSTVSYVFKSISSSRFINPTASSASSSPSSIQSLDWNGSLENDNFLVSLTGTINSFGFRVLSLINETAEERTTLYSPLDVMAICGILLEGAEGLTKKQLLKATGFSRLTSNPLQIHETFEKLFRHYKMVKDGHLDRDFDLFTGIHMMIAYHFTVNPNYQRLLERHYLTPITEVNFSHPEEISEMIDQWACQVTRGRIDHLPNVIRHQGSQSLLLLANVIHFKGNWVNPFDPKRTTYDYFTNLDGTSSRIKFMFRRWNVKLSIARIDEQNLKIISLPFLGDVNLIILMPYMINILPGLISTLNDDTFNDWLKELKEVTVDCFSIPKINLHDDLQLNEILPYIGINLPFVREAQLGPINYKRGHLRVTECLQETMVDIDECSMCTSTCSPNKTKSVDHRNHDQSSLRRGKVKRIMRRVQINKPFLFVIRDNCSGVNLVVGQVVKLPDVRPYRPRFLSTS